MLFIRGPANRAQNIIHRTGSLSPQDHTYPEK
jgi:hypothetical protein